MKVERIDHIAIRVKNLKEANKFFAEVFGMEFAQLGEIPAMDARSSIEPLGIEIVEPLSPNGPMAKSIEKAGEGLSLLSLKVDNLDEVAAVMKARGIRQIGKVERPHIGRRAFIYHPKDTYGVMIELIEYKDKHPIAAMNK
jgi:methylmalonyl-CoA/ethylmalonyl-CoA epimerase